MRGTIAVCLVAAAAAVAVYVNSLDGKFVWDDRMLIVGNPQVKSWDYVDQISSRDFFHGQQIEVVYGYYRPLTTLSYVLDYEVWGLNPFGFHLTNVPESGPGAPT